MLVLSQRKLAEEKTKLLLNGYSAYAENKELIRLIQRNISRYDLDVILDKAETGCWFIPSEKHQDGALY